MPNNEINQPVWLHNAPLDPNDLEAEARELELHSAIISALMHTDLPRPFDEKSLDRVHDLYLDNKKLNIVTIALTKSTDCRFRHELPSDDFSGLYFINSPVGSSQWQLYLKQSGKGCFIPLDLENSAVQELNKHLDCPLSELRPEKVELIQQVVKNIQFRHLAKQVLEYNIKKFLEKNHVAGEIPQQKLTEELLNHLNMTYISTVTKRISLWHEILYPQMTAKKKFVPSEIYSINFSEENEAVIFKQDHHVYEGELYLSKMHVIDEELFSKNQDIDDAVNDLASYLDKKDRGENVAIEVEIDLRQAVIHQLFIANRNALNTSPSLPEVIRLFKSNLLAKYYLITQINSRIERTNLELKLAVLQEATVSTLAPVTPQRWQAVKLLADHAQHENKRIFNTRLDEMSHAILQMIENADEEAHKKDPYLGFESFIDEIKARHEERVSENQSLPEFSISASAGIKLADTTSDTESITVRSVIIENQVRVYNSKLFIPGVDNSPDLEKIRTAFEPVTKESFLALAIKNGDVIDCLHTDSREQRALVNDLVAAVRHRAAKGEKSDIKLKNVAYLKPSHLQSIVAAAEDNPHLLKMKILYPSVAQESQHEVASHSSQSAFFQPEPESDKRAGPSGTLPPSP